MNEELEKILGEVQTKDASVLCREVTSIGDTMEVLRAKWNVQILTAVLCGQTLFKDIMASVKAPIKREKSDARISSSEREVPRPKDKGISEKVLADRLRQMAEDKLIDKHECYGHPPRVEQRLTEHGRRLYGIGYQMTEWGMEYRRLILG